MTRPWTPNETLPDGSRTLHVKRCCENCGREIGDVTREEVEAAIVGAPLPSVAAECGCPATIQQLALYLNGRDTAETGTANWEHLDITAHESYLRDAAAIVRAMVALGWAPREEQAA